MSPDRRRFLHWCAALGLGLSAPMPSISSATGPAQKHSRIIPSSGEHVPVIGLGTWLTFAINLDDQSELKKREAVLREFLNLGGGILDSSPMYGVAEKVIGVCLEEIDKHKGLFSATKVWTYGNREGSLQMENSFHLWGLKQFDLLQVHNLLDWQTHLPTLHAMKREGRTRYVGVTTSHGRRHERLLDIMRHQELDFVQFTYNILDREAEQYLLPMAADHSIAVIINRPFQGGALFDRFKQYSLPPWAHEINCSNWAQFFLKFIVSHPDVTCAIPATSNPEHLRENMGVAYGPLPDSSMRARMVEYVRNL